MTRYIRRRYVAVIIDSEQRVEEQDFFNAFWASFTTLFGEYGASQANIRFIEFYAEHNCSILRCSHKALEQVKASVVAITKMNGISATVHIQRVSGTLKSLRTKLQKTQTATKGT